MIQGMMATLPMRVFQWPAGDRADQHTSSQVTTSCNSGPLLMKFEGLPTRAIADTSRTAAHDSSAALANLLNNIFACSHLQTPGVDYNSDWN